MLALVVVCGEQVSQIIRLSSDPQPPYVQRHT